MAKMSQAEKNRVPASKRAGPKGHWPLQDKSHVQSAVREEKFANASEKKKINAAAKKDGVKNSSVAKERHIHVHKGDKVHIHVHPKAKNGKKS